MSVPISSSDSPVSPQEEKQPQKQEQDQKQKQKQKERAVNPRAIRPDNIAVSLTKENIKITQMRRLFGF